MTQVKKCCHLHPKIIVMDFSKRINIVITDTQSGKVLGHTHKDLYLSDNPQVTLEGNQFLERWLCSFVRGCAQYDNVSIQIDAQSITIPVQQIIAF